jgi:hypothetical protein
LGGGSPEKAYQSEYGSYLFSAATLVYIPTYNATTFTASTWKCPTTSPYSHWTQVSAADVDRSDKIPYLDDRTAFNTSEGREGVYVIHADRNTNEMYTNKRGDICQYLGKTQTALAGYRLPMSSEFGTTNSTGFNPTTPVSGGWIMGTAASNFVENLDAGNGKADGTADFTVASGNGAGQVLGYAVNQTMSNLTLPASGNMEGHSVLANVGLGGGYWAGSAANNNIHARYLYFAGDGTRTYLNLYIFRSCGFPVRCVKND